MSGGDGFVLVDDFSTDDTVAVARKLPIKAIQHPFNIGYGANQKTCYLLALADGADGADIVITLHPDRLFD